MKTLALEQMPLPPILPVNVSRTKAILLLIGRLMIFGLFFFMLIVGVYGWAGGKTVSRTLSILITVSSAFCLWAITLELFQSFKCLKHFRAPPLVFTRTSLQAGHFSIPWVGIEAFTLRGFSNGKRVFYYAHVEVANPAAFPVDDLTGLMLPYFYKRIKKSLKLPPNAVLIPLELFDRSANELMILLRRYWSDAKGQSYTPQSLELLYPQKKFSDFVQPH